MISGQSSVFLASMLSDVVVLLLFLAPWGQETEILQGTYFDSLDSEKEGFISKAGDHFLR